MKNKLAIGFSLGIGTMLLIAATEYDLNKGVDLTGASSVTATKLNQLVDNGTVATNKGMIIYSSTTPDTTNNARYTRFIWLNSSYTPPVPYVCNSSLSLWTNITAISSIADGSVTAGKLGANAVYATNIANAQIDNTKMVAGTVNSNILGANSVYNFHLTGSSIYSSNIVNGQLLNANYGAASITGDKIAPYSIGTSLLTNGFALQGSNIAAGTITSTNVVYGGIALTNISTNGASASQQLRFNAAGTALEFYTDPVIYVTTNMTMSAGVNTIITNLAHSLGGLPDIINVKLYCAAASVAHGYTTGSYVPVSDFGNVNARLSPVSVMVTPTALTICKQNTTVYVVVQSTGAEIGMTDAQFCNDWKVQITLIKYNR